MAGKIPREFIDDLIARVDIVDLIDARVPLKKAGVNYSARCPFHSEKTPSFTVNREKQFYHCFGCGAHGNAIGFLMDYERQSFVEAIETLADSVGVEIPRTTSAEPERDRDRDQETGVQALYEIQEQAAHYYSRQLREHPDAARAVDYLKRRGVSGEIAKHYRLGYAPPGWHNLPNSLPAEKLLAAGLTIAKEGGGHYDRLRDRIVFPIRDRRGRVVGFGGRVLGEETPKYLNSPETAVFKKHKEVFGLYELLKAVPKPERILVVEGYMDVIALAQHGIGYAVATLGTATSADHANLLFRYARELVFCFDGDSAGQNAAWKALEASLPALREGRSLLFLMLPEGHDPDSLVREEGKERFEARLDSALPFSDYFFQQLGRNLNLRDIEGRAALHQNATPLLEKLPAGVFKEMMLSKLGELTRHEIVKIPRKSAKLQNQVRRTFPERSRPSGLRVILALLVQNPRFFGLIDDETRARFETMEKTGRLAKKLFTLLEEKPAINSGGILERFREEEEEAMVRALSVWDTQVPNDGAETVFKDALKWHAGQHRQQRLEILVAKAATSNLSQAEREEMRSLLSDR